MADRIPLLVGNWKMHGSPSEAKRLALELRNRLGRLVGAVLPASLLFDHPTIAALTEHLATAYLGLEGEARPDHQPLPVQAPKPMAEDEIATASEADLDAALGAFATLLADSADSR